MRGLLILTLILTMAAACLDADDPPAPIKRAAERAIEKKIGGDAQAEITGSGVLIKRHGKEYVLTLEGEGGGERVKLHVKDFFIPNAALLSDIEGAGKQTITLSVKSGLDKVEEFYRSALPRMGFEQDYMMREDDMMSGTWLKPGAGFQVQIYAIEGGGGSKIVLVLSVKS